MPATNWQRPPKKQAMPTPALLTVIPRIWRLYNENTKTVPAVAKKALVGEFVNKLLIRVREERVDCSQRSRVGDGLWLGGCVVSVGVGNESRDTPSSAAVGAFTVVGERALL